MMPHPFTTINPKVDYCLAPAPAPAPAGSYLEEGYEGNLAIGLTHGQDSEGRRLILVLLKDVAGLVPGEYQGRGRNNDLTDADVLIHILDASGRQTKAGTQ